MPEKIYLLGSYAWGKPDENSDLDLLVLLSNSDISKTQRASRAYRALRSYSNIPIDILVRTTEEFNFYAGVNGTLNNKISSSGRVLYDK